MADVKAEYLAWEQRGQVNVSPNKEERLKIDNYEEVIISSHYLNVNSAYFRHIVG